VVPVRIRRHGPISIQSSYPLVVRTRTCAASQLRKRLVYNPSSLHADVPGSLLNSLKIGGKQGALSPCLSLSDLSQSSPDETLDEGW
jgi:hypothetical protein